MTNNKGHNTGTTLRRNLSTLSYEFFGTNTEGEEISDRILTLPNVISFIRLCAIPIFFVLLLNGRSVVAGVIFGLAALTDFVDGQVARRTNSVSKLGKVLDPTIDRLLVIMGVLGVFIVGRLPLWIIVVILGRDLFMLIEGAYILEKYHVRVDVLVLGKFVTTFIFIGFFGLMINQPQIAGLGWVSWSWLPGFNAQPCSWGIWLVYLGLVLGVGTTTYYITTAAKRALKVKAEMIERGEL